MYVLNIRQLDGSLYFRFDAEIVEEINKSQIPSEAKILSFTEEDYVWKSAKGLSNRECEKYFAAHYIKRGRIINLSKTRNTCYGTALERITNSTQTIAPGILALEDLVRKNNLEGQSGIFGLIYQTQTLSLLIAAGRDREGGWTELMLSFNWDERYLDSMVGDFFNSPEFQEMKIDTRNRHFFEFRDLYEIVEDVHSYPRGASTLVLPTGAKLKVLVCCTFGIAGVFGGYGLYNTIQFRALQNRNAEIQAAVSDQRVELSNYIKGNLFPIAREMSLEPLGNLAEIEKLWLPGTKVDVMVTYQERNYLLRIPLEDRETSKILTRNNSISDPASRALVLKALDQTPEGLTLIGTKTNDQINEIGLVFTPKNYISPIDSLLTH